MKLSKDPFSDYVLRKANARDCDTWVNLLELIRGGLGI